MPVFSIVLLVLAVGATVARARVVAYRRGGPAQVDSVIVLSAVVLFFTVLWGGISWGLHGVLHALLSWKFALAALGAVVGGTGWVSAGMGGALVFGFLDPDPDLLRWWIVPILIGHVIRELSPAGPRPPGLFTGSRTRGDLGFIQPPTLRDRTARALHLLAGAAPLALAFRGPSPAIGSWPDWTLGLAVLITGQAWWLDHLIQRVPRPSQRGFRVSSIAMILGTCAVAATPVGEWTVALWRSLPGPAWLVGGAVLVLLDAMVRVPPRQGGRGPLVSIWVAVALVIDPALRRGLYLYAVVVVFHPAPDLLPGVAILVCAEAALTCLGAVDAEVRALRGFYLSMMFRLTPAEQARIFSAWLFDAFLARPGRPDYGFVTTLSANGALSGMGRVPLGQAFLNFDPWTREPMKEQEAFRWVEVAEAALTLVEEEVMPRCPAAHLARLRRDQARARAQCHVTRALLCQYLNWRDTSIGEWLAAARHAEAGDAPNGAAMARANAALILAGRLARPGDALRLIEDGPDPAALTGPIRRHVLTVAALARMVLGDVAEARSLLRQSQATPLGRADWAVMRAEELTPAPLIRSRTMPRVTKQALAAQEAIVSAVVYGEPVRARFPREFSLAPGLNEYLRAAALIYEERYHEAKDVLRDAHAQAAAAGHLTWSYNSLMNLADLALLDGDARSGYRLLREAVTTLEEMRGRVLDADLRIGAGAGPNGDPYERAAFALVLEDLGVPHPHAEAFELVERGRSRVFLELLGGVSTRVVPPELRELAAAEQSAAEDFERALREGRADEVRTLRERLDAVRAELRFAGTAGAEYADLREGRPVSQAEIRQLLGDGVVLGEFLVTDGGTLLFLVRAGEEEPEVVVLEQTRVDLRTAAEASRTPLPEGGSDWQDVFRALVRPLADACAEGEHVCLVPHDVLHMVPLHAVEIDGVPFGSRNPVSYLPSASTLRYCTRREDGRVKWERGAVLLADSSPDRPLVHARVQATAIAGLFGPHAQVLTGPDVTRTAVRERSADVWHVACHGEFDDGEPGRSGILLAPGEGRLTATDVLSLRLDCDLVTLSACRTGLSALTSGDELIGLTRALIYAGASSAVVSLWSVDEISTSILMEEFYTRLVRGEDKSSALGRAQDRVRTMTVTEAIAYCERALERFPEAYEALSTDIADLRARARDLRGAEAAYLALAGRHEEGSPEQRRLLAAATRCRHAARHVGAADYQIRPYADLFHWAAFVLVGDWR
ncbi:CHAT domain-containing protein [Microbispora sp. NEAU-D428]|uniref:CHAT domain-containing protein n=1 Tax=Microbispora sitophila TaxID=2771537 RepID=UPI0018696454|nr:CHAT domain-containing protein [Microbispora sitophila]MBE3015868.1 CHAT domain-containing protein [Microbispora sitophila]